MTWTVILVYLIALALSIAKAIARSALVSVPCTDTSVYKSSKIVCFVSRNTAMPTLGNNLLGPNVQSIACYRRFLCCVLFIKQQNC